MTVQMATGEPAGVITWSASNPEPFSGLLLGRLLYNIFLKYAKYRKTCQRQDRQMT